ncbi:MAG: DNA polymerase II small subunit, partial [Thermoproteota archaeon]
MKKDVVFALNYALNKGFQIHPNAFEILEKVEIRDLEKVIRDIVREKTKQKVFHINQEDLEVFLGLKEEEELLSEHKILSDPTLKITSSEGIIGFG